MKRQVKLKGRGALSNPDGRFERTRRVEFDDGWAEDGSEEPPSRTETVVTAEPARTVISRNASPDVPFEQSINPYRGCEHGCIYCYARASHSYLNLSPGLDFETRLFYKENAAQRLEEELSRPNYVCKPITLGANTDPYQPIERRLKITRGILDVLHRFQHPVSVITKSGLIRRDLDVLGAMGRDNLASVMVSVTTLDPSLKRILEPRTASHSARLDTIQALADAGVAVGVLAAPMIPAVNDKELESILEAAAQAGARWAGYILLRLPYEVKELFREWLQTHFPLKASHVLSLLAQAHGGSINVAEFGERMRGSGPYAELLSARFTLACRRYRLNDMRRPGLDTSRFRPPERGGQLSLW